jgi:hypothetical protein
MPDKIIFCEIVGFARIIDVLAVFQQILPSLFMVLYINFAFNTSRHSSCAV